MALSQYEYRIFSLNSKGLEQTEKVEGKKEDAAGRDREDKWIQNYWLDILAKPEKNALNSKFHHVHFIIPQEMRCSKLVKMKRVLKFDEKSVNFIHSVESSFLHYSLKLKVSKKV